MAAFPVGLVEFVLRFYQLRQILVCQQAGDGDFIELEDLASAAFAGNQLLVKVPVNVTEIPRSSLLLCTLPDYSLRGRWSSVLLLPPGVQAVTDKGPWPFTVVSYDPQSQTMFESYFVKEKSLSGVIARWDDTLGFEAVGHVEMWERRLNMGGVVLKSATIPWEFVVYEEADGKWSGCFAEVLEILGGSLNFTVNFSLPADRNYGQVWMHLSHKM